MTFLLFLLQFHFLLFLLFFYILFMKLLRRDIIKGSVRIKGRPLQKKCYNYPEHKHKGEPTNAKQSLYPSSGTTQEPHTLPER